MLAGLVFCPHTRPLCTMTPSCVCFGGFFFFLFFFCNILNNIVLCCIWSRPLFHVEPIFYSWNSLSFDIQVFVNPALSILLWALTYLSNMNVVLEIHEVVAYCEVLSGNNTFLWYTLRWFLPEFSWKPLVEGFRCIQQALVSKKGHMCHKQHFRLTLGRWRLKFMYQPCSGCPWCFLRYISIIFFLLLRY